jgi:solute carrier family 25 citrate transporter 1
VAILKETVQAHGVRGLYSGSGALITGNALKAGTRFMTYDTVKDWFRGADVSASERARLRCEYECER